MPSFELGGKVYTNDFKFQDVGTLKCVRLRAFPNKHSEHSTLQIENIKVT